MGCPRVLVLALAAAAAADKRTIQRVGLWHLEKAGGTWVGHVLRRAFPDKFESVCEHCMHGPKALTDPRVWSIGLMREPCDYYLAAWSWGRLRRAGWLLKKMERMIHQRRRSSTAQATRTRLASAPGSGM